MSLLDRPYKLAISTIALCTCMPCHATPRNRLANQATQQRNTSNFSNSNSEFNPGIGVLWHTKDGAFSLLGNYLLQMDGAWSSNDPVFNNDTAIARSKLYLSGNLLRLQYTFTYEFVGGHIDQANIGLNWNHFNFQVGQIDPYFSLVNDVSDNAYNFIGAPLVISAFSPNYSQGIALQTYSNHFVDEMTLFGRGSGDPSQRTATLNATMRLLYVPYHQAGKLLHFGVNFWQQTVGSKHQAEFFTMPELMTHGGETLIGTGTIDNTRSYQVTDAEFVAQKGAFNVQSELINTWLQRSKGSPTLHFNGYYILASYFLTGETRTYLYPDGYFTGITPIRHKWGALQLLGRYSFINLNDHDIHGGAEHNVTLGMNWYSSAVTELSINYIRANANPASFGTHQSSNLYVARFQINL